MPMMMNQPNSFLSEDPAPTSPSNRHPSFTPADPLSKRKDTETSPAGSSQYPGRTNKTNNGHSQYQTPQTLPSKFPAAKEDKLEAATTEISMRQDLSHRSKSSGVHARRRSYHDKSSGFHPSFFLPPPQWPRRRHNGVSAFPRQITDDFGRFHRGDEISTRFFPHPNCIPFQHQSIPYCNQPHRPSSFEKRNQSSNARMQTTGLSQSNNPWSQASDRPYRSGIPNYPPRPEIWRNGYQMHGPTPKHSWGGSVKNNRVGDGNMRTRYNNLSEDSKRRLAEGLPERHRKYAVRSPEQEHYGGDLRQNSYTGKSCPARYNKRHSVGHDLRPEQGFELFDNYIERRSRYEQFFLSADHPPPSFYTNNSKHRHIRSPVSSDKEQLPRYIGDILNSRDQLVEPSRYHGGHSYGSPGLLEERGNGIGSLHAFRSDRHIKQQDSSNHLASYRSHYADANQGLHCSEHIASENRDLFYRNIGRSFDNRTEFSNESSENSGVVQEYDKRSIDSDNVSKASGFPKNKDLSQDSCPQTEINGSKNDFSETSYRDDAMVSDIDYTVTHLKTKSYHPEISRVLEKQPSLKDASSQVSTSLDRKTSQANGVDSGQGLLDAKAAKLSEKFSKLTVTDDVEKPKASAVEQSSEAQQDLAKAQELGLPIKIGPTVTECSEEKRNTASRFSHLNPWAEEFDPNLKDSSGNVFTVIKQNGTCFFRPLAGASHVPSDPRYVIQHDRQLDTKENKADVIDQQEVAMHLESETELNYQHMSASQNAQACIELQPPDQHQQLHPQLQQQMYLPINHRHQNEASGVFYSSTQSNFQQQPQQQNLLHVSQLMDQTYTPIVPVTDSVFAYPLPMPVGVNMTTTGPQELTVPYEVSQENDFIRYSHHSGLNQGKSPCQVFPITQHNQMFVPSITTVPDIQATHTSQPSYIELEPSLAYATPKPGIGCIPFHHFPTDMNGIIQSPVANIQGHSPYLADQIGRFPQMMTPVMHQAFAPQGHMIYPPITPVNESFITPAPLHHRHDVDTNLTSQIETAGPVTDSSNLTSVRSDVSQYRKIKDTLLEVLESLRPQASLDDEDKSTDSEDDRLVSAELSDVFHKLIVIQQHGDRASLQRNIASLPENSRTKMELMLKLLCIVSNEKTSLSSCDLRKIVCLHRALISKMPASLIQNLIKLLPEVGNPTHLQDRLTSSLEQLLLKTMEAANIHETSSLNTDPGVLSNCQEQNTKLNYDDQSTVGSGGESTKFSFAVNSHSCSLNTQTPQNDSAENFSIQTRIDSITANSLSSTGVTKYTPGKTIEASVEGKNGVFSVTTGENSKDLASSQFNVVVDESDPMTTAPKEKNLIRETELVNRHADLRGEDAEKHAETVRAATTARDETGLRVTSRTVLATPTGVTADSVPDSGHQSRTGTPHPNTHHRALNRVSCRDIRSPAFDQVDIASRIGVFERIKSKR